MNASKSARGDGKPAITITNRDYDIIAGLALVLEGRSPDLSKLILDEIDRADVRDPGTMPPDVVMLGSEVVFLDDSNGTTRLVRLVLPAEADIDAGRVSVMTPVGAGLIGMSVGSQISWPCPDGRPRVLKILEVRQQA